MEETHFIYSDDKKLLCVNYKSYFTAYGLRK